MIFNKKKKASTLLEVTISLALVALLVGPAMNMIVASVKNIQKTKVKEKAELIGKQIVEEIKALDLENLSIGNITLSNNVVLTKDITSENEEIIRGSNYNIETNNNEYDIDIIMKKNTNVKYDNINESMDAEFNVYIDSYNNVEFLFFENVRDSSNLIKIPILNNYDFKVINTSTEIQIQSAEGDSLNPSIVKTVLDGAVKPGFLKINFLETNEKITDEEKKQIKIEVDNKMGEDFNIFISKRVSSLFKEEIKIDKTSIRSILVTTDEFDPKPIGDMYDFTVRVNKDGKELFKLNGYKNINL